MSQQTDGLLSPKAADLRAVAIAKLKRAASLPRMKDGRRPAMHSDGVSEGEKSGLATPELSDLKPIAKPELKPEEIKTKVEELVANEPDLVETRGNTPAPQDTEPEAEPETEQEQSKGAPTAKRRSRSRSRSRGSKDLRKMVKPPLSPSPQPGQSGSFGHRSEESSQDDEPSSLPSFDQPPTATAPTSPLQFFAQQQQLLALMKSAGPTFYPNYPPVSPPSLEALQARLGSGGLNRSNSAAARLMAMHKLTGGTELPDHAVISPVFPTAGPTALMRNNTVSGGERGERSIARNALFQKLNRRNADGGDQTSGGEDTALSSARRQRRRSRRRSAGTPIIDDRDPPSTSPNTPIVAETPLILFPPPIPPVPGPEPPPSPAPSHTSSHTASVRRRSLERNRNSALAKLIGENQFEFEAPRQSPQRRLVVEADEDQDEPPVHTPRSRSNPSAGPSRAVSPYHPNHLTPPEHSIIEPPPRPTPQISESHSVSTESPSGAETNYLPVFPPETLPSSPFKQESSFPTTSPWDAPLKERVTEDEEEVVYQDENRNKRAARSDPVSWVDPEDLEPRIPVDEDSEQEDEATIEEPSQEDIEPIAEPETPADPEPPSSVGSRDKELPLPPDVTIKVPDIEESNGLHPASGGSAELLYGTMPVSPALESPASHVEFSQSTSTTMTTGNEADESSSSEFASNYLDMDAPISTDASPLDFYWDNPQAPLSDVLAKTSLNDMTAIPGTPGRWDTIKRKLSGKSLTRAPSANGSFGRRSRSNSIARREVESGASRESASSIASARLEHRHSNQGQLSASESMLSLAAPIPPRGGVSPIPPASAIDTKYTDSKLHPLPGIVKLQQDKGHKRGRGMSLSASTPDVTTIALSNDRSYEVLTPQPDLRRLSSQASDSRLQLRYQQQNISATNVPKSATNFGGIDYFSVGPPTEPRTPPSKNTKLPMDRQGVRHWLKKFVPSQANTSSNTGERNHPKKKLSLSDVLSRREIDSGTEWEEITNPGTPSVYGKEIQSHMRPSMTPHSQKMDMRSPYEGNAPPSIIRTPSTRTVPLASSRTTPLSTPQLQSMTPAHLEPANQLSPPVPEKHLRTASPFIKDSPSPTTEPSTASQTSLVNSVATPVSTASNASHVSKTYQAADLAQRINQLISTEDGQSGIFTNPPRRLVSSNTVVQIVNGNTVKQRVLLLFNDVIVLAKPAHNESSHDAPIMRLTEPMLVKHVVRLEDCKVSDGRRKTLNPEELHRYPTFNKFVLEFKQNVDMAIANLTKGNNDAGAITWLLFNTFELDKNQLGSYLSRRSSKHLLRSYIDHFGFAGVRIDQALRVFWISIRPPISQSARDNLLSGFAARWFEANSQLVSFDRDLAMRLVGSIMQLNQILHPGNNPADPFAPPVQVGARDFIDAFRRYDPRMLVSDEMLEHIHVAIQQERLATALDSSTNFPVVQVTTSGIPNRLTYRVESDPIIVRLPRPDSNFSIQLIGQGLLFNPPILDFSRSAEASFRVTGTVLGTKSMIMSRIGPHAPYYSGVPSSMSVTVERAFMRNCFQLTMPLGDSHRDYLFSIDENQRGLVSQLEHHISENQARRDSISTNGSHSDGVRQASEVIAFKVLCDSLLQGQGSPPMGGHLLKRQLQQPPSQRTGKDIAVLCRQNSLLPSILMHAYGSPV